MAEREIVWSRNSEIQLQEILEFYIQRNKSNRYSKKLYNKFKENLKLVADKPESGVLTKLEDIRGLIVGDYILFYKILAHKIVVLKVWDSRQDPDKLNIPR